MYFLIRFRVYTREEKTGKVTDMFIRRKNYSFELGNPGVKVM